MNDTEAQPRRSLVVVLLDGVLRMFAAVQAGATPEPKVGRAGGRRRVGRYVLLTGVLAALAGTALLVVVLVRAPGDPTPPPDPAAALPAHRSRPAGPSAAGSATPASSAPTSPSGSSSLGKGAASQTVPTSPAMSSPAAPGSQITENTSVRLAATYKTASATAGLLGYQMTVTVANQGAATKTGWVLSVTLPRPTLLVSGVKGATASQNGAVWTFTPDATTASIPAGGTVQVVFGVHGATLIDAAPKDCRIDGNPCNT
jgi:hypothetical protein